MYYPDLHTECALDSGPETRAVGWLDPAHPFPTRPASPRFLRRLADHLESAWSPADSLGPGGCQFCGQPIRPRTAAGLRRLHSEALWIPGPGVVYVAPGAVLHYVSEHSYAPPEEFVAAVMACPIQGSREYLALLRRLPTWWTLMLGGQTLEEAEARAALRRR